MTLLAGWLELTRDWASVFSQQRTFARACRQGLGSLVCLGRRCLTRILWTNGAQDANWASDYLLHSRCRWDPQQLFRPILRSGLEYCPGRLIGVALDDTRLRKTGRCIPQAFYQKDPLSPPFHLNLLFGLRFLQASLLLPLHRTSTTGSRAVPIRFQEVAPVKRPGRKATEQMKQLYKTLCRQNNLSRHFVTMAHQLRAELDQAGAGRKLLVLTGDGSFCNRTCFADIPDRAVLLVRCRKDARLCFGAPTDPGQPRRFYAPDKFTPEQVRQDDTRYWWKTTKVFYGGGRRKVRYKEVAMLYWQNGAGRRPLRLIVIAATPYRKSKTRKRYYRQPAYLLTSDLRSPVKQLLQIYFDRWQIEVNHREEKDTLGVGQAQLRNPQSVPRQPVLCVAAYAALLLASLRAFGADRGSAYAALPKWRRKARRPSCLDLITLLRKEMAAHPELTASIGLRLGHSHMVAAAAA